MSDKSIIEERDIAIDALHKIADPIGYLLKSAEDAGCKFNALMGLQLAANAGYLSMLARNAIEEINSERP